MGERSTIEWTDATFNPWWGCRRVSPACDSCYAERFAAWVAPGLWDTPNRRTFGDAHWQEPLRWARTLPAALGRRPRVFCASMADVFDKEAPAAERERLWDLIRSTPELDWLLLTKRIPNIRDMLPPDWGDGWLNVWLGATVVTQAEVDRDVDRLLAVPAFIRFLSLEPLLEPVDLNLGWRNDLGRWDSTGRELPLRRIDWVIVGGESGPRARPLNLDWVRSVRDQCAAGRVPTFVKQLGARPYDVHPTEPGRRRDVRLKHKRGGDPWEWPEEFRVRQFPAIEVRVV